jgi:alkanesulfonate monooxygenase SsuD/methylene tetrahydromethanopterin reductase-like flavin-dependent oxidoreductase (luciferase family)
MGRWLLARSATAGAADLLAGVAAVTSSVELGTAALTGALRHPLLAAHAVATVDRISGGRLVLGLGGLPLPSHRGRVRSRRGAVRRPRSALARGGRPVAAAVEREAGWSVPRPVLVVLRSGGLPSPARPGGPPLWLAGGGPTALRRAGEWFDGWLPYLPEPDRYREGWKTVRAAATDAGRAPSSLTARCTSPCGCAAGQADHYGPSVSAIGRSRRTQQVGPLPDGAVDSLNLQEGVEGFGERVIET